MLVGRREGRDAPAGAKRGGVSSWQLVKKTLLVNDFFAAPMQSHECDSGIGRLMRRTIDSVLRKWIAVLCIALVFTLSAKVYHSVSHADGGHLATVALSLGEHYVHAHSAEAHHSGGVSDHDEDLLDDREASDEDADAPHAHHSPVPQMASVSIGDAGVLFGRTLQKVGFAPGASQRMSTMTFGLDRPPKSSADA